MRDHLSPYHELGLQDAHIERLVSMLIRVTDHITKICAERDLTSDADAAIISDALGVINKAAGWVIDGGEREQPPQGWVLVPENPTGAMFVAWTEWMVKNTDNKMEFGEFARDYRAMLAAVKQKKPDAEASG